MTTRRDFIKGAMGLATGAALGIVPQLLAPPKRTLVILEEMHWQWRVNWEFHDGSRLTLWSCDWERVKGLIDSSIKRLDGTMQLSWQENLVKERTPDMWIYNAWVKD
jgi:hypothetical protein